jgi:hypothetical protein
MVLYNDTSIYDFHIYLIYIYIIYSIIVYISSIYLVLTLIHECGHLKFYVLYVRLCLFIFYGVVCFV